MEHTVVVPLLVNTNNSKGCDCGFYSRHHMDCLASPLNTDTEDVLVCPECAVIPQDAGWAVHMNQQFLQIISPSHTAVWGSSLCACPLGFRCCKLSVIKAQVAKINNNNLKEKEGNFRLDTNLLKRNHIVAGIVKFIKEKQNIIQLSVFAMIWWSKKDVKN